MADTSSAAGAPAPSLQATNDGWQNIISGLGDPARDKRKAATPNADVLDFGDMVSLYRGSDTAARIVDLPAEEMLRAWFDIRVEDNEDASEEVGAALEDLKIRTKFLDAIKKQRAFGGCAVLMGVEDGISDLAQPVNEKAIKDISFLTVFEPGEATVQEWNANPADQDFGEPAFYQINPRVIGSGVSTVLNRVHGSRVLRFSAPFISRSMMGSNMGWGDSVFDLVWEVIRDFDSSYNAASALLSDFSQAVFKIKGLSAAVAADRSDLIRQRLMLMDMSRSVLRGLMLDADGEDFERKPTPISGLPEVLDRFANRLAAAVRIPVTKLMGVAPAGLNATGDSDVRNFYDFISGQQALIVQPPLEKLARLLMLAKKGPTKGAEPDNWSIKWRSLWQETETEQAGVRKIMAETDQIYQAIGALDAGEIRQNRFEGDAFSIETIVDADEPAGAEEGEDLAAQEGVPRIGPDGKPVPVMPGESKPAAMAKCPECGKNGKAGGACPECSAEIPASAPNAAGPGGPAPAGGSVLSGPGAAAGAEKAQDTALNGAQIVSAVDIVKAVAQEELPRDSGLNMLIEFFNLAPERAEKIMGSVGKGFTPKAPEPPPMPFGAKPGAPEPKPGEPQPKDQPTGEKKPPFPPK